MVCAAPLVDDAEVRQFLKDAAAGGVALVERRFRDGISTGEIPSDFPVTTRARQVIDLARGLTMHAQLGAPRKTPPGGRRRSGRVGASAAAWKRAARKLMLDGVKVGASNFR